MTDGEAAPTGVTGFNHLAVAVPDVEAARRRLAEVFGLQASAPEDQPAHGVRVAFLDVGGVRVELMEPLGEASPIAKFLERNPRGGLHHLCLSVEALEPALERARRAETRVVSGPAPGAHDKPVAFLHPADICGMLVEIEED